MREGRGGKKIEIEIERIHDCKKPDYSLARGHHDIPKEKESIHMSPHPLNGSSSPKIRWIIICPPHHHHVSSWI
jgi:hypothetical protein